MCMIQKILEIRNLIRILNLHLPRRSVVSDIFGSDEEEEDVVKSKESVKASEEDKVCDNEAVNYSDVSDKEIDASQSSRDLSVSPINSDQSESFEKAATLEGLNPEAISPEEDFTSLSEEEEGELKNYERRKQLKIRKKELQKKVKELERQVIEISPDSAPLDLNGLLEDGEINEEEKKKSGKLKEKVKKKTKRNCC